jgi:hypothetical protein
VVSQTSSPNIFLQSLMYAARQPEHKSPSFHVASTMPVRKAHKFYLTGEQGIYTVTVLWNCGQTSAWWKDKGGD